MTLEEHAKKELEMIGAFDKDGPYDGMVGEAALQLIKVFASQGHSGMSASLVSDIFSKLSQYLPLSPLTGSEEEWEKVAPNLYQNRRCSHIFKENGVGAYNSEGRVFREKNGNTYLSQNSRIPVIFPHWPKKPEIIDVD